MKRNLLKLLVAGLFFAMIVINSCEQMPTEYDDQTNGGGYTSFEKVTISEGFETGTKTSYTAADVTLGSGTWNLNEALIGNSTSDRKSGTKSARVRNTGKLTMKFDRTDGISTVTIKHAKYGTDGNTSWQLWYSTNSGSSWIQTGSTITTSSTTLQTASFTINKTGNVRLEIRKTSSDSYRTNFDDIVVNDYAGGGGGGNTETESNNTSATANAINVFPTTLTGYISATSDIDYFKITTTAGQTVTIGLTIPSSVDYDIYLQNSSLINVASSENGTGASESINYSVTTAGTYYIKIISYSGSSTTSTYSLTASVTGGGGGGSTSVHLTLGNPSGAVTNTTYTTNYLMEKTQYCLSYNKDRATPNWTAWHLNSTWLGSTARQDDFRADATLPSGWYQVGGSSYSGSGFDRGHMCPSADRTKTVADNSSTFLMTNMVPQAPNNNQGPWARLEDYCRTLVSQGKELYIYSGAYGVQSRINNNNIVVPTNTWKVIVVLDEGTNDVTRVSTSTRVIAVNMTNYNSQISMSADWKSFRVSVDSIESITGYDFLSNVSTSIQSAIESTVDNL